jgi:RNA polymerase sigma-70 factor (ECF subfamily)
VYNHSFRNETDEALMIAIADRNAEAFAVLYDRYGQRMYRYFYRMLRRDAARSEDFTQDLFLKIIEKANTFRQGYAFKTWVYTIAANMCKNEFRRVHLRENTPLPMPDTSYDYLPESLDQQLLESELRSAIDQLEEPHRTCFVLRYQEELSVRDISAIMDCPEGTVKSRLHHALRKVSSRITID